MTNPITLAAALFARLGYSRTEAATYLGVRTDTVKKWVSGKMEMPDQIQDDLRSYIRYWERFCRMEAEFYTTHFDNEPYAIIAYPEEIKRAGWGIPDSSGFIEATIGAISAHMDVGMTKIKIIAEGDVKNFVGEYNLPKDQITAALHWIGLFDDMLGAQIGIYPMMQVEKSTVDKMLNQLEVDQKWYSVHQNQNALEECILTFKPTDSAYEGDLSDEKASAGYGFELWLTLFEESSLFVRSTDECSMRFRMDTGERKDVGFCGDGGNLYDITGLNIYIESRLKQIFGTPAKMLKELSKQADSSRRPWIFNDDR